MTETDDRITILEFCPKIDLFEARLRYYIQNRPSGTLWQIVKCTRILNDKEVQQVKDYLNNKGYKVLQFHLDFAPKFEYALEVPYHPQTTGVYHVPK